MPTGRPPALTAPKTHPATPRTAQFPCTYSVSCAYPAEAALALAINPKNDSGQPYRYTVEETSSSVAGASASYTNDDGIQTGEITVTNTLAEGYELPETGGSGTIVYLAVGLATAAVSAFALLVRRRHTS